MGNFHQYEFLTFWWLANFCAHQYSWFNFLWPHFSMQKKNLKNRDFLLYSKNMFVFFSAWTGAFCTEDVNGCLEVSCFQNADCDDAPAPMIGAICPDCPPGYQGDGEKCFGKVKVGLKSSFKRNSFFFCRYWWMCKPYNKQLSANLYQYWRKFQVWMQSRFWAKQ